MYRLCRVREISPGTHTFFHTYTCPVYCWRSVQLLDFGLFRSLIHASQPVRDFCSSGQCFASGFLQTPPHDDALASSCILPTAGRIRDSHPLERAPAGRTKKRNTPKGCSCKSNQLILTVIRIHIRCFLPETKPSQAAMVSVFS